jgi:dienelactone hydrolase
VALDAEIVVPPEAPGLVAFAHGSGSSRHSPRNRFVAAELQHRGLGTVLIDLLTEEEEDLDVRTGELRFDIELLSTRVIALTDWLVESEATGGLGIGIFGASTGAAAAFVAAAARPLSVQAVVSRGGRADLAQQVLHRVSQPTLLIVGARDEVVLDLNRRALGRMSGEAALEVVPGATHLFEEPGALEHVARAASEWFARWLHPMPAGHEIPDELL